MRAVVVRPPAHGAELRDVSDPVPMPGDLTVRVLEAGICGTDRDIVSGKYGRAPPGRDTLILGHENLGRVERVPDGTPGWSVGDLVVATVRRGCGECRFCLSGRSDFCETGKFTERGIGGRDGYLADRYCEAPEYLVKVPEELRPVAVLLEPLSVVEKAVAEGRSVLGRYEPTPGHPRSRPYRALVTGTGAVGMLAALVLTLEGFEVLAIDRHDESTPAAGLLRRIGASHRNVAAGLGALGEDRYDLIVEASGVAALDFALIEHLRPNGVEVLTGIPPADEPSIPVLAGQIARELVLDNQAVLGSVNANRSYFERGLEHLAGFRARWGPAAEALITERRPLTDYADVLEAKASHTIKTVLSVSS
jgi:threonine dehydrogenase-like Zn-dependent dehydrogenase